MPKEGPIFDAHIKAKLRCKSAMRFIKQFEDDLRRQSLATKLANMDTKDFWKEIKNVKNATAPRPLMIDGVTGEENIALKWKSHFQELLNSVPDSAASNDNEWHIAHDDITSVGATVDDVKNAILKLKKGKANGPDGLSVEHIDPISMGTLNPR